MRKIIMTAIMVLLAASFAFAQGSKELQQTRVTVIKNGNLAMFSDDLGRSINVDNDGFTKVIAGTPAAQNYIYTIDPSRLYGLAAAWPENAKRLIAKAEENLPIYGIFDYMADGFDWEKLKTSGSDAVLIVGNIGNYKSEITALLDEKQEEIGIPLIFINDEFPFIPTTINRIALIISSYENRVDPNQLAQELMLPLYSTKNIVSYYYSGTEDGLTPYAPDQAEASVMEYMGLKNVVAAGSQDTMTAMDIANANPDLIILDSEDAYNTFINAEQFKTVRAVQEGNVYLVPDAPYNILSEDAGAGRLIGLSWMRMLAYKNLTMDNVVDNADDFYEDFYHSNLSDIEIKRMLNFN
jgi:iron complex transport system substrate-binding protein